MEQRVFFGIESHFHIARPSLHGLEVFGWKKVVMKIDDGHRINSLKNSF
jgi:hypothetical protein